MASLPQEPRPGDRENEDYRNLLALRVNGPPLPRTAQQETFDAVISGIDRASQTGLRNAIENAKGTGKIPDEAWGQIIHYVYYLVQADCDTIAELEVETDDMRKKLGHLNVVRHPVIGDFGLVKRSDAWIDGAGQYLVKAEVMQLVDVCFNARRGLRAAGARKEMAVWATEKEIAVLREAEREIKREEGAGGGSVKQEEEVEVKQEQNEMIKVEQEENRAGNDGRDDEVKIKKEQQVD